MKESVNTGSHGFTPEMMASIKEWREHGTLADLDCICDRILLNWEGIDDYLDVKATLMLLIVPEETTETVLNVRNREAMKKEMSDYKQAITERYSPARTVEESTHRLSTEEICAAINKINPGVDISASEVYDLMKSCRASDS